MQESEQEHETSGQEGDPWRGWFEVIAALILGLATLGSAWSAYQSALWGGIQDFRIVEANVAGRQAGAKTIYASQLRMIDATLLERYLSALSEYNQDMAAFLFRRFRPESKVAVEAWLATKPLENPSAPLTPFAMAEYSLAADKEAQQFHEEEARKLAEARDANEIADTYLLLTVLFGVVLFLGGITAAFESQGMRGVVLTLSVLTMTGAAIAMAFLPLAAE